MRPEKYKHKHPYLKSTAFRSWLYSYLLVLCLVIITSASLYIPMVSREKQKTYTQYELIAEGLLQEINKEFSGLTRFISLTSQDSDLAAFLRAYASDKVNEMSDRGQRIQELAQQLNYYTIGLNYMEDYIVYFPASDYVYRKGSFLNGDLFFDVSVGKSYTLLRNRQIPAGIDLFAVEDETGERFVFYAYSTDDLCIYVRINTDAVIHSLSQYEQMINGSICLTDENGRLLIGSCGTEADLSSLTAGKLEDGAWYTENGTSSLLRNSADGHLRVVFSVSEKTITRDLAKFYALILGGLFASAICGCCLSVLMARRNYRQFDALAREVIGDEDWQHANYPVLIDAIQSHTEMMQDLRKRVRRDGILSVMHKDEDSWRMNDDDLDDLEKQLLDRFVVCTFLPVSYNGWKATFPNDGRNNLLYRRILLPLQTLLGDGYTVEEVETEHTYTIIID